MHATHRLDWEDVTLREWDCTVLWSDPLDPEAGIVLDRSAFYPGGGGQPPDHGVLLWQGVQTRIVDIVGLDTQADGGTHVFSTRQIGRLEITKVENKGRQNRRVRIRLADTP